MSLIKTIGRVALFFAVLLIVVAILSLATSAPIILAAILLVAGALLGATGILSMTLAECLCIMVDIEQNTHDTADLLKRWSGL